MDDGFNQDDYDEDYLIPATPSPVFKKQSKFTLGKPSIRQASSVISISSDDDSFLLRNTPSSLGDDNNILHKQHSNNINKGDNSIDSPVFSTGLLALPGHANFARERAEALRRKKQKHKTSPFKVPNQSSLKYSNTSKPHTDFVKSSSLLKLPSAESKNIVKPSSSTTSGIIMSPNLGKRKYSHEEGYNFGGKRKPVRYLWPSSSESSSDEGNVSPNFGSKHKKSKGERKKNSSLNTKVEKSSKHATHSSSITDRRIISPIHSNSGFVNLLSSNGPHVVIPKTSKNLSPKQLSPSVSCLNGATGFTRISPKASSNHEKLSPENGKLVCGFLKHNSKTTPCKPSSDFKCKVCKEKFKNRLNHMDYEPANSGKYNDLNDVWLSPKKSNIDHNTFTNINVGATKTASNTLSKQSEYDNLSKPEMKRRHGLFNIVPRQEHEDRKERHRKKYSIAREARAVEMDTSDKTKPSSAEQKTPSKCIDPGSADCPINIDQLTPQTKQALKSINQLQDDEEMARQMQEQMDHEFALSIQNNPHNDLEGHVHHEGTEPHYHTGADHMEDNPGVPHWHMYSPVQPRRRGRGGARRRNDELSDELNDLFSAVNRMNPALALPDFSLDMDERQVAQRRRRGRRGAQPNVMLGGMVFSPNAAGNDYESLMNLADMLGEVKEKGLTKTESARLPVITFKATPPSGEGAGPTEEAECNICMMEYEGGDSQKMLPCFHVYHAVCIDKWLGKNRTCPVCRVEVKLE